MSGIIRSRVRVNKTCKYCQSIFTVANYRKDSATYCNRKCMALDSRLQLISTCNECNTQFEHLASRANIAKYCSPICYHKAMSRKGTKEYSCFHCQVKFLSSPSKNRKYCSKTCVNKSAKENFKPKYSTVRKAMLSRNMLKKCANCGFDTYPKILGVHHKDRNRDNNSLENLIVLCPNCHSIEHMKHVCHGFTE